MDPSPTQGFYTKELTLPKGSDLSPGNLPRPAQKLNLKLTVNIRPRGSSLYRVSGLRL